VGYRLPSLFGRKRGTLNISCLEDTQVLAITYDDKEKICADIPQINTFHRHKCNMGYGAQQRRILSLLSDDARTRYEQFLELYPSLLQRLPKSLIASYLGVSRET
jgi:cyclic nucleotide-binding protein